MKRILPLLLTFVAILSFGLQLAYAQAGSNSIIGAGGDLYPNRKCAPVDAKFVVRFFSTDQFDLNRLKITIDWGNGDVVNFAGAEIKEQAAVNAGDPPYTYFVEKTYTYLDGGDVCEYFPTGYLYVDGVESNEKVTRNLVVWDKDDANGGEIVIAPARFLACPGQEFTVTFDDVSDWNCTPPEVTDKMNKFSRWTRFTYGTVENETATPRIADVKVGGAVRAYPYQGNVKEHTYTEGGPAVIEPDHTSLSVTVPADAKVGEIFEIKLENWNMCNPYDAANEGNAVFNYAYIEIVAPPALQIVSDDNVCPNTAVDFSAVETTSIDDYSLFYSWEVFDDPTGSVLLASGNGMDFTYDGFSTSGEKLVRLKAERTDLGDDFFCEASVEKKISVEETPTIKSFINGVESEELSLCFDSENPSQQVNYTFNLYRYSTNKYEFKLSTFAVNSSSETPDGEVIQGWTTVLPGDADPKEVVYSPEYTQPGKYRVQIAARDMLTGCIALSESVTIIYGEPLADFTFNDLCHGQQAQFTDASSLPKVINGDTISSWAWDFTNDGVVDATGKNPSHTYANVGTYEVALEVKTKGGCSHRVVKEVKVYPVPQASLAYNYTQPICPGDPVIFENLSLLSNTSEDFPDGIVYTLLVSDGVNTQELAFTDAKDTLSFQNTSNVEKLYTIRLKAKANTSNCQRLSAPLEVRVKPGAKAAFYEPDYNPIATNCAPVELNFIVDQPTLGLNADTHTWVIVAGGAELLRKTFTPGQEGYAAFSYVAENNKSSRLLYEVSLLAEKAGTCIQPAEQKYQIAPVPAPEDFPVTISQGCDTTLVHVKVNQMAGILDLHWTISPQPANHASLTYDDDFTLIYLRPGRNEAAFQVDLSLVKENYFGCQSEAVSKQVDVLPQVIDDVKLQLLSGDTEGCSPLEAIFANTTDAPAGTTFELHIKRGLGNWQVATIPSEEIDDNFSYTFTASGSYIVRLKATAPDGCSRFSTSTVNLVVYDDPQPNFTLDKTAACAGFTASFIKNIQGSQNNYWTVTDLTNGTVDGPFANLDTYDFQNATDAVKVYEVRLRSVSAQQCEADSSLQVQVYPAASAAFTLQDADLCAPFEVVVENTSVNPAGTIYTWNWDDGSTTTSSEEELRHTYANGSYTSAVYKTITLTATTPDGCVSSVQQQLSLQPQVLADFSTDKAEGCAPLNVYFTNRSKGNSGAASGWYLREAGAADFTALGTALPSYQFINEGSSTLTYEVLYVALNAGGCSDSLSREIKVHPQVQPAIVQDAGSGCGPLEVLFTNNKPKAREIYIWEWADGSAKDTTRYQQSSIRHTFENASTSSPRRYRVQVQALDTVSGCSSILYKDVSVQPTVVAEVVPSVTEGCAPLQLYFQNYSRGADSHSWVITNMTTGAIHHQETNSFPTIPELTNTSNQPVVYQLRYVARNSSTGCSDEQLVDITVKPGTQALFELDYNTVCAGAEVLFTNLNIQQGVKYIWRWNDGEPNDTTTTEQTIAHTFVNTSTTRAKQFEVELIAFNPASDCGASYKKSVRVNPALELQVSPDNTKGCAPLAVNFRNQSKNVSSHRWYVREQGSSQKEQEQTAAEAQFSLANQTGQVKWYEVVYVGVSSQGCADSTVSTIQVYPQLEPAFTTDSVRVRLPNSTFQLLNETPHAASWTTRWDFGDGTTSTEVNPGSHTYGTYGKFTITLTVSNGLCSESYSQEVLVNEILPIVDFESIPVAGCGPLTVQFKNNSQYADPETYFWDFGDGEGYSTGTNPSYTYYKPGEYTVTLRASNPTGEVVSTSYAIVTVYGKPKIDFEIRSNIVYVPGEPLYVANYTRGGKEYIWNFGDGTEYREFEPVHYYKEPGIYTISLIAINEWGCADTLVREEVVTAMAGGRAKIPNAFTPSTGGPNGGDIGAGNNDVFYPVLEGGVVRYNLKIFNRWGELLFESNSRQLGWDGYYKGSLSKADVYVYKLSVEFSDGRTLDKLGDLTLIR